MRIPQVRGAAISLGIAFARLVLVGAGSVTASRVCQTGDGQAAKHFQELNHEHS